MRLASTTSMREGFPWFGTRVVPASPSRSDRPAMASAFPMPAVRARDQPRVVGHRGGPLGPP
eukprot:10021863-Lingulodinium_polyedra.AAC.1